jgi:hypothetical protein
MCSQQKIPDREDFESIPADLPDRVYSLSCQFHQMDVGQARAESV